MQVGAGQFQYDPTGSPWTFSGQAGISANNSTLTSGNPPAPGGSQVAFLENAGSFSESTTNWAAGSYSISFSAAQRANGQASQQDFKVSVDGVTVGNFTPSGTSYQSFATSVFTVAAGAHTITFQGLDSAGGDNIAFVDRVAATTSFPDSDPGFEQVSVGAGQFQYRPSGSPWTFSGQAGISGNNSGFTAGNPAAPEGAQVALLQGTGSFSQSISNWAAGSYSISFYAAQRGNHQASRQDLSVLVNGTVVGGTTPSGTSYQSFTTAVFTVTAGAHTITFQGLDSAGGDNTAFIDLVVVQPVSASVSVGDPGFEQVSVGAGQFQYRPTGSPWTFSGQAGISGNNSGFTAGNPAAPEGSQVAFLQGTGSFSQSTSNWAAGSYSISFYAAQRGNHQASRQDLSVLVNGTVVGGATPSGTSYQSFTTAVFTVTAGAHTITFQGLDSAGGDNTAFIDLVVVQPVSASVSVGDPGFEQVSVGAGQFQYRPTGSPWTFSGQAGISGNNSGFTAGNPAAPEGPQVAFLQGTGSFSQSTSNWAAGSYSISFYAAQRGNHQASRQDLSVLVNGTVVGGATPSGTSYQSFTTAVFTVTAGAHTITFQGLDSAGGDNTAFIDQVTAAAKSTSTIGLVAAYSFGEGAGTSVTDASGNSNTGTITNATWTAAGKYGDALMFDGTSSLVTINDSPSLDLTTGITLEAWVNPSAVSSNWADVIYKGNDNYFLEGTSAPSGVPGAGGTFGGSDVVTLGTASLPTNTWSYLAATYDGATLRLYVNGTLVSSLRRPGISRPRATRSRSAETASSVSISQA